MQTFQSTASETGTDGDQRDDVLRQLWSHDISVRTKDGIVVLSGVVRTLEEKLAAGRAAKSVYGVKGVANYIAVRL